MPRALGKITEHHHAISILYNPREFTGRSWLVEEAIRFRNDKGGRQLIIVGEPGSGKSSFLAYLAEIWNCPRYFIRIDNIRGVTGVAPRAFLISIGKQLYQKYGPEIFEHDIGSTIQVTVGKIKDQAKVVGRSTEELYTLPFLPLQGGDIHLRVASATGQSQVIGEHVKQRYDSSLDLDEITLLHKLVISPLNMLQRLYPDECVVVIIDALDEAAQHSSKSIIDIIPHVTDADFPPNLRLLMTSRPGKHLIPFQDDLLDLDDKTKGYWQASERDARMYIDKRLSEAPLNVIVANWPEDKFQAFVREVGTNADNNFLYLYHFFNEAIAFVQSEPTDLQALPIPKSLDDIYRVFAVNKIKANIQLHDWVELYLPLLGTLAVIREPVERELLAGFAHVKVDYVDYIIGQIEQFLNVVKDNRGYRYQLYHTSFCEYLLDSCRNREYPLDGLKYHYQIASYYLNQHPEWTKVDWQAIKESYPFDHLPAHLEASGHREDLVALLKDLSTTGQKSDPSYQWNF